MKPDSPWLLLVDFDGTLTLRDADFVIADALLGEERGRALYEPLARRYESLNIGTMEYFDGYLAGLGATPGDIARCAVAVPVRSGLEALVRWCDGAGVRVRLVSEGIDLYIEPLLEARGIRGLDVSANVARYDGEQYRVTAPSGAESCARCLNCKGAHVRRAQQAGSRVAVVGNGSSDLCGARLADLVLARDILLEHCEREGIASTAWDSFEDVRVALERALQG